MSNVCRDNHYYCHTCKAKSTCVHAVAMKPRGLGISTEMRVVKSRSLGISEYYKNHLRDAGCSAYLAWLSAEVESGRFFAP